MPAIKQGGPAPALIKAEVPWSARRGTLSDKDRVLKTIKGYFIVRSFISLHLFCTVICKKMQSSFPDNRILEVFSPSGWYSPMVRLKFAPY